MKFFRSSDTGEIISLRLEARDTLEEMAAQAPMRMDELAAKIEDIIQDRVNEGAVEDYKSRLVAWLQARAEEEEMSTHGSYLKPAPLLRRIVEKIENGEI